MKRVNNILSRFFLSMATLCSVALTGLPHITHADYQSASLQDQSLRIAGSSTVFPYMALITERLVNDTLAPPPIVEANGTGAGIKLLCTSPYNALYIATASRPITKAERQLCLDKKGEDVAEIPLGLDGLIVISPSDNTPFSLTKEELYLALAQYVPNTNAPDNDVMVNPYNTWYDINPNLPDTPILIYGPPANAGLFEAITYLVFRPFCQNAKDPSKCKKVRRLGKYVEMPENSTLMLEKVQQDFNAVGLVSYRFYDQNRKNLQALPIDGIEPSAQTIADGSYPMSRKLYLYMLSSNLTTAPIIKFLEYLFLPTISGPGGKFQDLGLIPLPTNN